MLSNKLLKLSLRFKQSLLELFIRLFKLLNTVFTVYAV